MICIETEYFSLNRTLLLAIGLWPYKQSKFARLQFIIYFGILTSAILFQFTTLLTSKYTSDLVIKVLSTTLFFTTFVIKYISFAVNAEDIKDLMIRLQHTYSNLKDECENAIIKQYSYNAQWYTVTLTVYATCGIFILIVAQFWSNIFDIILSRNISSHHLPIMTEYFIDQEKYFYLIVLHIFAATCIGIAAMIATGTMLIAYLQHTCGMLRISRYKTNIGKATKTLIMNKKFCVTILTESYRIERAMDINMLQNITLNENLIFKGIIYAVDIHRQAMRLSKLLLSKFEIMLFCLIIVGVISLSLNLFRINPSKDNFKEFLFPILFIMTSILYMFIANYIGQNVMDHTDHVFVTAYSVPWYVAPLHIQRLILFLLQRSAKHFTLGVGGLFIGSLECFATLVKASVSYFTVMYSMR